MIGCSKPLREVVTENNPYLIGEISSAGVRNNTKHRNLFFSNGSDGFI